MRSAILRSAILDCHFEQKKNFIHSFSTELDDGSHLEFCHLGFSHYAQKHFTHSFSLNLMMAAILNSAMLDSATAILDSDTLLSSLRFTQKHSHSTLTLTQTHSFSINLMMAAILNSAILDLAILNKKIQLILVFSLKLHWQPLAIHHLIHHYAHKRTLLIHSDSTWWWQPSWILPCWIQPLPSWIQTPCYLLSHSLKNTLTPLWLWLKVIKSN